MAFPLPDKVALNGGKINPRPRGLWLRNSASREDLWVIHAFQKKSTQGIKTPTREVDLIKDRLKRLKEMLQ